MKTLKQLREEYDNQLLDSADFLDEEVMLEATKKTSLMSTTPSFKQMPSMLLFRRITYRKYPNDQVVALYYSTLVDKYLSIPFGPTGNLNLSEAVIHEKDDDPCWKGYEQIGMKKKGGRKVPNCVPVKEGWASIGHAYDWAGDRNSKAKFVGKKPKPTSTKNDEKDDTYKNSKQGGKVKFAKSIKEESKSNFKNRLTSLREQRIDEGWRENLSAIGKSMPGYEDKEASKVAWKKGDYLGAIKSQGKALGKAALTGAAVAGSAYLGARTLPSLSRGAKALAKRAIKSSITGSNDSSSKGSDTPSSTISTDFGRVRSGRGKSVSLAPTSSETDPTNVSRSASLERKYREKSLQSNPMHENKMSDIRKMIKEDIEYKDLNINGRTVTLNSSMAKRILEVYDSVNTKNKKIVEGMLNEDIESFKKLLNFTIKA